jgi:hypothetical protein
MSGGVEGVRPEEEIVARLTGRLTPEALEEVAVLLPQLSREVWGSARGRTIGALLAAAGEWIAGWEEGVRLARGVESGYGPRGA